MLDVSAYLGRIGYAGPRDPTRDTLRALHAAHLLAVPFENLDIGLGRPIALDDAALFDKIVARRRGGFCYELNGLFAALLRALGFAVTLLSAGVRRRLDAPGPTFGPEFDHLALRVDLAEPWLVDVGFGDAFRWPLRLGVAEEQIDGGKRRPILGAAPVGLWQDRYRIARTGDRLSLQRRDWQGGWHDRYRFTLTPRAPTDFAAMCRYHQTSPDSGFTRRRTCTIATAEGRATIDDDHLIITRGVEREERPLRDERQYAAALREHFGIALG